MSLASGSPVQAVLFYGMKGSGKMRLADILSKSWLCIRNTPGSHIGACGECQACLSFERGRSADRLLLEPVGPSRIIRLAAISPPKDKDDEDENYPVSAQYFLRTPPLSARLKVVVIDEIERMNSRAANSLLKILEEPPPYGRFILLTDSVGSILPTVLSRCLAVACEVPSSLSGVENWAQSLAAGAPERALEIQEWSGSYRPIYEFAAGLSARRRPEALAVAEQFSRMAENLGSERKIPARSANAEALQILATAFAENLQDPQALLAIVESHRRILGNANASAVFDALFAAILR